MALYPFPIAEQISKALSSCESIDADTSGTAASFTCGCFATFKLRIDDEAKTVANAYCRTNGCGYMVAAGDLLAEALTNKRLGDLKGLNTTALEESVEMRLGEYPPGRRHCLRVCLEAIQLAFADHRYRTIEDFRGGSPLVCSCFGVSEDVIEQLIEDIGPVSVDEITAACHAGSGCGSCRMLIQEMIDGG